MGTEARVNSKPTLGSLGGLRVLELADEKGEYCGKLLADMGADVIKVEAPGGESTRDVPPLWKSESGEEFSLNFLYMNANKRAVVLDLGSDAGCERFRRLAATADLIVETRKPGELDGLGLGFRSER